jgi:hypothetical protein
MAKTRNVFVAFWLLRPERGEDKPREVIEELGCPWAKIAPGIYYLHGEYDAQYVGNKVWAALNMDDKMVVLDTTNNDARWFNIKPEVSQFLIDNWHSE